MRPESGSALADLVFDPNDANLAGRIEFLVRKALERCEPRIALKEVRARPAGAARSNAERAFLRQDTSTLMNC
jgi:phage baseplate assembly protein W